MSKLAGLLVFSVFATGLLAQDTAPFEFHSGFLVNLHHFLYEQATAKPAAPDGPQEWQAALAYYSREIVSRDLLSEGALEVNNRLSGLEGAASLKDSGLPSEFIAVLEAAAPIYRDRWWHEHDRVNRAWIQTVTPLVSKYSGVLKRELVMVYATDWPAAPIRTDVTEYAGYGGAYTTLEPTHITVSSSNPGNQGDAALEVLFHEASHSLVAKLRNTLSTEVRAENKLYPYRDFWHAVLFYTTGEVVRRHLEAYSPYAVKNGLSARAWPGVQEILDVNWKPYLDGKIDMITGVRRIVVAYGISQ